MQGVRGRAHKRRKGLHSSRAATATRGSGAGPGKGAIAGAEEQRVSRWSRRRGPTGFRAEPDSLDPRTRNAVRDSPAGGGTGCSRAWRRVDGS